MQTTDSIKNVSICFAEFDISKEKSVPDNCRDIITFPNINDPIQYVENGIIYLGSGASFHVNRIGKPSISKQSKSLHTLIFNPDNTDNDEVALLIKKHLERCIETKALTP